VLGALQRRIEANFPQAQIVGADSPPFHKPSASELAERDERIRQSGATMVWVGLGTPKQDYEVARLARDIPVVALAVGAAFDFLAGTTPQAPVWMQRNGLEWAYRLASEPRRLGKRYLWGNSIFIIEASRTIRRSKNRG
jgi:N-acetylglucosaminyldiphosphoundecaprenol N-acetyl-beta-D-mannosaminyltransferase